MLLSISNIHAKYSSLQVLHGINLEVEEGEIVALLGGNGAGKTTTINTISGIVHQTEGTIIFNGQDISNMSSHKRLELGIVQVPEGRKLFPTMTVMDNLLVGSYLPECRARRKENLEWCFELFPRLYERKEQMAGSMSGGEQQMCAIARGLMQCPKLLMLDEPSLGLAPVLVEGVFKAIQKVNEQGVTILLVEQNVNVTLEIAHRGYVIETGTDVLSGTAKELSANDMVRKSYLGIT